MEPVTGQPQYGIGSVGQAALPTLPPIAGCPPGLEYLGQLDQVLIHQEVEMFEALTGIETCNKFKILNSVGQQIYYASEESSFLQRVCFNVYRGFTFHITDNSGQAVMRVRREFKCCKGCSMCVCLDCNYYAVVEDRQGGVLGYVSTLSFCCKPRFGIYDENMQMVAEVRIACCACQNMLCTADLDFPVVTLADESQIATVKKTWQGAMKSCFTKADNFSLLFPATMDVKMKALLIGSVLVVDMMWFEQQNKGS